MKWNSKSFGLFWEFLKAADGSNIYFINGAKELLFLNTIKSMGVSFKQELNTQTGKDLFSRKIIAYKRQRPEF